MNRSLAPFKDCPLPFPGRVWRVKVLSVTDGDTIYVLVDRGWEHFQTDVTEVRFASLDAYESRGNYPPDHIALGKQAKAFTAQLCDGRWAYLLTRMDPEKYGRILGDPFPVKDDGTVTDVCWMLWQAKLVKPGSYTGTQSPRLIDNYLPRFGA